MNLLKCLLRGMGLTMSECPALAANCRRCFDDSTGQCHKPNDQLVVVTKSRPSAQQGQLRNLNSC